MNVPEREIAEAKNRKFPENPKPLSRTREVFTLAVWSDYYG